MKKDKGRASLQVKMARKFLVSPWVRAGPPPKMKIRTGVNKRHQNELKNCLDNARVVYAQITRALHVAYEILLRESFSLSLISLFTQER